MYYCNITVIIGQSHCDPGGLQGCQRRLWIPRSPHRPRLLLCSLENVLAVFLMKGVEVLEFAGLKR